MGSCNSRQQFIFKRSSRIWYFAQSGMDLEQEGLLPQTDRVSTFVVIHVKWSSHHLVSSCEIWLFFLTLCTDAGGPKFWGKLGPTLKLGAPKIWGKLGPQGCGWCPRNTHYHTKFRCCRSSISAQVGGPQNVGNAGPCSLGWGCDWPLETCFFQPVLLCQVRSI